MLCLTIILQRKGKINEYNDDRFLVTSPGKKRNSIVMFPTNGVGFGHFTRIMAIARRLSKIPRLRDRFFYYYASLHIPSLEGITATTFQGDTAQRHGSINMEYNL